MRWSVGCLSHKTRSWVLCEWLKSVFWQREWWTKPFELAQRLLPSCWRQISHCGVRQWPVQPEIMCSVGRFCHRARSWVLCEWLKSVAWSQEWRPEPFELALRLLFLPSSTSRPPLLWSKQLMASNANKHIFTCNAHLGQWKESWNISAFLTDCFDFHWLFAPRTLSNHHVIPFSSFAFGTS